MITRSRLVKAQIEAYDTIEGFDRDVRAMLEQPPPNPAVTGDAADGAGAAGPTVLDAPWEAVKGGGTGQDKDTASRRKAALTEEFLARTVLDRVKVESNIRARLSSVLR